MNTVKNIQIENGKLIVNYCCFPFQEILDLSAGGGTKEKIGKFGDGVLVGNDYTYTIPTDFDTIYTILGSNGDGTYNSNITYSISGSTVVVTSNMDMQGIGYKIVGEKNN